MEGRREGGGDVEQALVHGRRRIGEDKRRRSDTLEYPLYLSQLHFLPQSYLVQYPPHLPLEPRRLPNRLQQLHDANLVPVRVEHSHQSLHLLGEQLDPVSFDHCLESVRSKGAAPEDVVVGESLLELFLVLVEVGDLGKDLVLYEVPELVVLYLVVEVFVQPRKIVLQLPHILIEPQRRQQPLNLIRLNKPRMIRIRLLKHRSQLFLQILG